MKSRGWMLLAALAPLVSLGVQAQPAPGQDVTNTPLYSFTEIQETWERATKGKALEVDLKSFPGGSSGGDVLKLEEPSDTASVTTLPVRNLEASMARELHRRSALLERMLTMLGAYKDPTADPKRSDKVRELGNAAHLEVFIAQSLFYLEGQTREEKCLSYGRALAHARFLGWQRGVALPTDLPLVPSGWEALAGSARSFFATGFTSRIPERLCELHPLVTRSDTEEKLRGLIDKKIRARVDQATDDTFQSLSGVRARYATALGKSRIEVPTAEIFALRRAVEDSASLLQFVEEDQLMLENAPPPKTPRQPQTSLLDQLREKHQKLSTLQSNASDGSLDETLSKAGQGLEQHQKSLSELTRLLREISTTRGLDDTTRASLGVCSALPQEVTRENHPSFVTQLDTCLSQMARALEGLKQRQGADLAPAPVLFITKVNELSEVYLALLNSHTQGS